MLDLSKRTRSLCQMAAPALKASSIALTISACTSFEGVENDTGKWITLFDGNEPEHLEVWISRRGLFSFDEQEIFTLTDDGMIQVLGEDPTLVEDALLMTKQSYENYRFVVEYRWGSAQFNRRRFPPNSGFLYHVFGGPGADDPADTSIRRYRPAAELGHPDGDDYGGWIRGIEYQMRLGDAGQALMIGAQAISTLNSEGVYEPPPGGNTLVVKGDGYDVPPIFRIGRAFDSETEWNAAEIRVEGAKARHFINGEEVMALHDFRVVDPETERMVPLTTGRVGIQAEGAELFIRKIALLPQ